jgi:hypothetical protein
LSPQIPKLLIEIYVDIIVTGIVFFKKSEVFPSSIRLVRKKEIWPLVKHFTLLNEIAILPKMFYLNHP